MRGKALFIITLLCSSLVCFGYQLADFDHNNIVDFADFQFFANEWTMESDPCGPVLQNYGHLDYLIAAADSSALMKQKADYICDGVDDQAEIQAAIDACPSKGGQVQLAAGTYTVSAAIRLKKFIVLTGTNTGEGTSPYSGGGTRIILANDVNDDVIVYNQIYWGPSFIKLSDLYVNGNKYGNSTGNGVHFYSSVPNLAPMDIIVDRVWAHNCKLDGFRIEGNGTSKAWGIKLRNCLSETNDGNGVTLVGSQCYVFGGFYAYNATHAMMIDKTDNSTFNQMNIRSGQTTEHQDAFRLFNCNGCLVSNSIFYNTNNTKPQATIYGINAFGTCFSTIIGNQIRDTGGDWDAGIRVRDCSSMTIVANQIDECDVGLIVDTWNGAVPASIVCTGNNLINNTTPAQGYLFPSGNLIQYTGFPVYKSTDYDVKTGDHTALFGANSASGYVTFNLPPAKVGLEYTFVLYSGQTIKLHPDTYDSIALPGGYQQGDGKYIYSSDIGASCRVKCIIQGQWENFDSVGSWDAEP